MDILTATEQRQLQTHSHLWYSAGQQSTQDLECLLAVVYIAVVFMDQKEHCRAPRKENSQSGFVAYMHHTYTVFVSPNRVRNLLQVG